MLICIVDDTECFLLVLFLPDLKYRPYVWNKNGCGKLVYALSPLCKVLVHGQQNFYHVMG